MLAWTCLAVTVYVTDYTDSDTILMLRLGQSIQFQKVWLGNSHNQVREHLLFMQKSSSSVLSFSGIGMGEGGEINL